MQAGIMKDVNGDSVKPWPQVYLASTGLSETYIHQPDKMNFKAGRAVPIS